MILQKQSKGAKQGVYKPITANIVVDVLAAKEEQGGNQSNHYGLTMYLANKQ